MFSGGDQYAFLHQAGGVAHPGHIPGLGLNCESFEIGAPEHDARVGRGGAKTQVDLDARVESDPGDGSRRCKSVLVGQVFPQEEFHQQLLSQLHAFDVRLLLSTR
jgi:hypothetical protein